jgi:predicted  nucleic acid-binding Zn-ribbon protein
MHIFSMIRNLLIGGLTAVIPVTGLIAEETAPAIADIETRRQSVVDLQNHIDQREKRLAEWGRDIVDLNERIERRVDELVTLLAGLRDSEDSRRRVTQMKKEAIEGLKQGIERYRSKRKEIREMVRTGSDEAFGDLGKIDEHIIKRIDQIAELTKSIPSHQDVDKYESDGGSSYWNGYYDGGRVSEEWRQNRRDASASDLQRKQTADALEKAIQRLEERRRSLKSQLAASGLSDAARTLFTAELGQVDAYQDHLQSLQGDVLAGGAAGGRAIGLEQAHDIENMIKDARTDLREDASRLFRSYDQFVRGRHYLEGLKENLAARKAWLEENDPKKPGTP